MSTVPSPNWRPAPRPVDGRPGPYGAPEEVIETLFIGNCVPGTTDQHLSEAFGSFGTLVTCFLLQKPSQTGYISGFVRYQLKSSAEDALQVANHGHLTVGGSVISAQWADKNSRPTTGLIGGLPPQVTNSFAGAPPQQHMQMLPPPPPPIGMPSYQVNPEALAVSSQTLASPMFDENGEEIATIWIGDVLPEVSDADLVTACMPYGTLITCFLLKVIP